MNRRWLNHWMWDVAAGIAWIPFSILLLMKTAPGGERIAAVIVAVVVPIAFAAKIWNRYSHRSDC